MHAACRLAAKNGCVSAYLHAGPAPGLGRMGALLALESGGPPLEGAKRSAVEELGRQLAMHAVAMKPPYLDRTSGVAWRGRGCSSRQWDSTCALQYTRRQATRKYSLPRPRVPVPVVAPAPCSHIRQLTDA